jgi:hypothetical protein
VVRFINAQTSTRYELGRILDYPHSYCRICDIIHTKHKQDLIEVMNYMLKGIQSKYDRFSARQYIPYDQAIWKITIDLHSLQTLKMSGALPLLPLYTFMEWTMTLLYLYNHRNPSFHIIFLRPIQVYSLILHLLLLFSHQYIKTFFFYLTYVQYHFYIQKNPTRRNSVLFHIYMKISIFRTTHRPSSGA